MGSPKSLKDMFPNISAPLKSEQSYKLPQITKNTLTKEQKDQYKLQKRQMMVIADSLRCPLCNSQLDGGVYPERFKLECSANPIEYIVSYQNGINEPIYESIRLRYDLEMYEQTIYRYSEDSYQLDLFLIDPTIPLDRAFKFKKKIWTFSGKNRMQIIKSAMPYKKLKEKLKKLSLFA